MWLKLGLNLEILYFMDYINKPLVLNARNVGQHVENAVYVGRPSKFGNPFAAKSELDREAVIEKFREYFYSNDEIRDAAVAELMDKHLICWCSPKDCHATIIRDYVWEIKNGL